jgi:hypothetical protein
MSRYHLAQLNIALLKEPIDSPLLADFVAALEPINRLADESEGFVWRLQTEDGDATAIRAFDDDLLIVNMSVWESIDSLAGFVYKSGHTDVMRQRKRWFEHLAEAYMVLWWVPEGYEPTVEDAKERLEILRANGPTPDAFTFKQRFASPSGEAVAEGTDGWLCPA